MWPFRSEVLCIGADRAELAWAVVKGTRASPMSFHKISRNHADSPLADPMGRRAARDLRFERPAVTVATHDDPLHAGALQPRQGEFNQRAVGDRDEWSRRELLKGRLGPRESPREHDA